MFETVKETLQNEGITRIGTIDIKECDIINPRLLPNDAKTAIIFIIPYRTKSEYANDGISEYARVYDYHRFASNLFENVLHKMRETTGFDFNGFCDHSPINEKLAAAKCGLGAIGKNSLYIDDVYGSFVFIGTIISNAEFNTGSIDIKSCLNCGKCVEVCPTSAITEQGIDRTKCLSAISQKKSKTEDEIKRLKDNNVAWGCDICQLVCPHNRDAKISPLPYFQNSRRDIMNYEYVSNLSDEEFQKYAFAYKGRKLILDNLINIEDK